MKESRRSDSLAPEARAAIEKEEVKRWPLIPRWFKALLVASAVFGVSYGSTGDALVSAAFSAGAAVVFVVGASCYSAYRRYLQQRLPR